MRDVLLLGHSGTPRSGGSGIQILAQSLFLDSGFRPAAGPGMTNGVFQLQLQKRKTPRKRGVSPVG